MAGVLTPVSSDPAAADSAAQAATSAANAATSASEAAASAASVNDANLVHKASAETITGVKTFSAQPSGITGASIVNIPGGSVAATDTQAAINELDGDVVAHKADTGNPHSVTAAQANAIPSSEKGAANGVATLDANSEVVELPAGAAVAASDAVLRSDGTWGASEAVIHVQDQKSSGTPGGSSIAGLQTRTLNTVVTNTITGASLASNIITLPPGTYRITARAPSFRSTRNKIMLYNDTDSTVIVVGSNAYNDATNFVGGDSVINGTQFVLAASKNVKLQHYTESALSTEGLGVAVNLSATEIYADVRIVKVA